MKRTLLRLWYLYLVYVVVRTWVEDEQQWDAFA